MSFDARPLIVTATLDGATFALADGLRKEHFPPARNLLAAHLTLFHALPAEQADAIARWLEDAVVAEAPMPLELTAPMPLGFGVALAVACPRLVALRARLAVAWQGQLTWQDRAAWRPHITVQNKVAPAEARLLFDQLSRGWQPVAGEVTGLALWRYDGGRWEGVGHYPFAGQDHAAG